MSEPFLGEIRMTSFQYPPRGWARCDGQVLAISQNQALFALLGTNYGGNGITTFALPDLRGRSPMHAGAGRLLAERGGAQSHTLTHAELPAHTHRLNASADVATTHLPGAALPAARPRSGVNRYAPAGSGNVEMHPGTLAPAGGAQPHDNMPPFLALSFVIAMQGIFPSPT